MRWAVAIGLGSALLAFSCAQTCVECRRSIPVADCENNALTPEEQAKLKACRDCALAACPPPPEGGVYFCDAPTGTCVEECSLAPNTCAWSTIATSIASVQTSDCTAVYVGTDPRPYVYRPRYERGLDQPRLQSRLTIDLVYLGESEEVVHTWTAESSTASFSSILDRMFQHDDRVMVKQSVGSLLDDFEKHPAKASVNSPGTVEAGSTKTLTVRDIKDDEGRPSASFNRLIVKAEQGRIENGEENNAGKLFLVGDGAFEVVYRAPVTCAKKTDVITVSSSCDIGSFAAFPPYDSPAEKVIARVEVPLSCAGWAGTFTFHTVEAEDYDGRQVLDCTQSRHFRRELTGTAELALFATPGDARVFEGRGAPGGSFSRTHRDDAESVCPTATGGTITYLVKERCSCGGGFMDWGESGVNRLSLLGNDQYDYTLDVAIAAAGPCAGTHEEFTNGERKASHELDCGWEVLDVFYGTMQGERAAGSRHSEDPSTHSIEDFSWDLSR